MNYSVQKIQVVRKLFALAYAIAANAANNEAGKKDNRKNFLPKGKIKNYNLLIGGKIVYDLPINYLIKQNDGVRKSCKDI